MCRERKHGEAFKSLKDRFCKRSHGKRRRRLTGGRLWSPGANLTYFSLPPPPLVTWHSGPLSLRPLTRQKTFGVCLASSLRSSLHFSPCIYPPQIFIVPAALYGAEKRRARWEVAGLVSVSRLTGLRRPLMNDAFHVCAFACVCVTV